MTMTSLGMCEGGVALGTCRCWRFQMSALAHCCGSSPVNTVGQVSESITGALLSAILGAHECFCMGTLCFGTFQGSSSPRVIRDKYGSGENGPE